MNLDESFSARAASVNAPPGVRHPRLIDWVRQTAALTTPTHIVWCDGGAEEYASLCEAMVTAGTLHRLDPVKRPNSFLGGLDFAVVAWV
jgi:phosphoenolpyruvate carboxykinase (GTP)